MTTLPRRRSSATSRPADEAARFQLRLEFDAQGCLCKRQLVFLCEGNCQTVATLRLQPGGRILRMDDKGQVISDFKVPLQPCTAPDLSIPSDILVAAMPIRTTQHLLDQLYRQFGVATTKPGDNSEPTLPANWRTRISDEQAVSLLLAFRGRVESPSYWPMEIALQHPLPKRSVQGCTCC